MTLLERKAVLYLAGTVCVVIATLLLIGGIDCRIAAHHDVPWWVSVAALLLFVGHIYRWLGL